MTPQLGRIKKRSDFLRAARGGRKWATTGLVLQAYNRCPAVTGRAEDGARLDRPVTDAAATGLESSLNSGLNSSPQASTRSSARNASPGGEEAPDALRVGFTASRKVGNAVARNRAKRRLRALSQELLPARGRPFTDYVLIARQGTLTRPFPALRADLEAALAKVERRRGRPGPERRA